MSRRLSKTLRAKKVTLNNTFAANMPKLDADGVEARLARALVPKRPSLRASLMVGTALSAAIFAGGLVNTSPAMAACVPGISGTTLTYCVTGSQPTITGNAFLAGIPPVIDTTIVSVDAATLGGNIFGNGIGLLGTGAGETLDVTTTGTVAIGGAAPYAVSHDGIWVHDRTYYGDVNINITNAGTIAVGHSGISAIIITLDELSNDNIFISNSGSIAAGTGNGITAINFANVDPTDLTAHDTNTIINSGAIGSATTAVGHDGILSVVIKIGGAGSCIGGIGTCDAYDPVGVNSVTNTAPVFSNGSSLHAITWVSDVYNGTAKSYSNVTNSGNLTSNFANGIHGFAGTSTYGPKSTAYSEVTISNAGSGTISAHLDGIKGRAEASANGAILVTTSAAGLATALVNISNAGNITSTNLEGIHGYSSADATGGGIFVDNGVGGVATATTTISNSGIIKSQYAGINGRAIAEAWGSNGFFIGPYSGNGTGGIATAGVTISNSGNITTSTVGGHGIEGFSGAYAGGYGYGAGKIGTGGTASATTSISNAATITSFHTGIYGGAKAKAPGAGGSPGDFANAKGGTATAGVTISNTGNITSSAGHGINGYSYGNATALDAYQAIGGTASATTSITNTGIIISH